MIVNIYQTVKEKDGTISAYIKFKDTLTGKFIKNTCVQGKTQQDFETQIQKHIDKILAAQTDKNADTALVQKAIDKITNLTKTG